MRDPNRKVVIMQWLVITILVAGSGVGIFMLMTKTDDYKNQLDEQQGSMNSLREQLRQAKNPTPTPSASLPESTTNGASPTPSAGAKASPSPTPTPSATPKPAR